MQDRSAFHSELDSYLRGRARMRMGNTGQVHLPSFSGIEHVFGALVRGAHSLTHATATQFSRFSQDQKIGLAFIFSGSLITLKGLWDLGIILTA